MQFCDKLNELLSLDNDLFEDVSNNIINEAGLLRKLFPIGGPVKGDVPDIKPINIQAKEKSGRISEPELTSKSDSKAPTVHVASYAIARGKGHLRVGVEGDKSLTKAALHIFKKGDQYHGFLVIPGPGGKRKSESFQYNASLIFDSVIYESISDVVLKFDDDDLGELFDLSNYKTKSSLSADRFSSYDKDKKLLDIDVADRVNLGRLPWGKELRKLRQDDPDFDVDKLRKLSDRYQVLMDKTDNEVIKFMYKMMSEATSKIDSREQLESVVKKMKSAVGKLRDKGDHKSTRKANVYDKMIDDFVDVIGSLDI